MKRTNDLRLLAEITEEFCKRNSFLVILLLLMFMSYLDECQQDFSTAFSGVLKAVIIMVNNDL